jgi:dTDP-4-dehydrorhamnose 3,5-epimerase
MATSIPFQPTEIPDVLEINLRLWRDNRGYFMENFVQHKWDESGLETRFVQDNLSVSAYGTLRGMHYQINPHGTGKYVRVLHGSAYDVAVDLRRASPTFGKWVGRTLSAGKETGLWIPNGFAHGFIALQDETVLYYKCTAKYMPEAERSLHFADPKVGIRWPIAPTLISPKDDEAPTLELAEFNF